MKKISAFLFPIVLLVSVFNSCKKDPLTLGEALEGDWRVFYFIADSQDASSLVKEDTFMLEFRNYNGVKGDLKWWQKFGTPSIVSIGTYKIVEGDNNLSITWTSEGGVVAGLSTQLAYKANIDKDTLTIIATQLPNPYQKFFYKAVRQ